uniref:Ig-like domain-containing protein n=1 Tax=Anser brachyrhynchus TaxID=132585 RepID=A0A8B9C665_9AVES
CKECSRSNSMVSVQLCAADTCQVTVRQPRYQEAEYSTQTVSLPCAFSASECSLSKPQVLWFRFFTNKHEDLCTPKCTNDQKFKVQISENSIALQINDLSVNDNAVYFCGIAFSDSSSPHSKRTGNGTVLTKRAKKKIRITKRSIAQELQKQRYAEHSRQPVSFYWYGE